MGKINLRSIIRQKNDELSIFFEYVDDARIDINPAKFQVTAHYF